MSEKEQLKESKAQFKETFAQYELKAMSEHIWNVDRIMSIGVSEGVDEFIYSASNAIDMIWSDILPELRPEIWNQKDAPADVMVARLLDYQTYPYAKVLFGVNDVDILSPYSKMDTDSRRAAYENRIEILASKFWWREFRPKILVMLQNHNLGFTLTNNRLGKKDVPTLEEWKNRNAVKTQ